MSFRSEAVHHFSNKIEFFATQKIVIFACEFCRAECFLNLHCSLLFMATMNGAFDD